MQRVELVALGGLTTAAILTLKLRLPHAATLNEAIRLDRLDRKRRKMAAFSKKQYVILTNAIVRARMSVCDNPMQHPATVIIDRVALEIGCALKKDNRMFDIERFLSDIRGYRSPK